LILCLWIINGRYKRDQCSTMMYGRKMEFRNFNHGHGQMKFLKKHINGVLPNMFIKGEMDTIRLPIMVEQVL